MLSLAINKRKGRKTKRKVCTCDGRQAPNEEREGDQQSGEKPEEDGGGGGERKRACLRPGRAPGISYLKSGLCAPLKPFHTVGDAPVASDRTRKHGEPPFNESGVGTAQVKRQ